MSSLTIILLGGGFALLLLIIGIVISISSQRSVVEERLDEYLEGPSEVEIRKEASKPLTDWIDRRVEGSSMADRISRNLARADIKMKPGEFIALIIISSFGIGVLLWFIGSRSVLMGLVGLIFGAFLPRMYLRSQQNRRLLRFSDQLPDMLSLMVNGLRAGYSTLQAMEAVSKELPPPICDEFRRVVQEIQLGVSMERSLDNLLRRIPSDDLDLVITAINVQREVGGNLAEILDTISYTIRERVRLKGEIRVLTSQVLYSGRMLSLMPIFVIIILYLLNREYMNEFFKAENFPCGIIALGLAGLLIIIGYFVMNKLAEVEV